MEATRFPPPPTYAEPTIVDERTKKASFNPIWLKWFLDVAQGLEDATNQLKSGLSHNLMLGLQGGLPPNEFYHITAIQASSLFPNPMLVDGDLIMQLGGLPARLPAGAPGQTLKMVGGTPTWV